MRLLYHKQGGFRNLRTQVPAPLSKNRGKAASRRGSLLKKVDRYDTLKQTQPTEGAYVDMNCVNCGHEIMEGAAFCPYCGEKVAGGKPGESGLIYQTNVKGKLKSGKLSVYSDRTEFATSSVQKTIYNYSALVAVRKKLGMGTVLGLGLDHIEFITEDGGSESCPVNRKDIHEAFLRIQEAIKPYLAQRRRRLLEQGIRYSLVSSTGLTGSGILNISDDQAELKVKSGQSRTVSFQDVKSVSASAGNLEFLLVDGSSRSFGVDKELQGEILAFVKQAVEPYIAQRKEALLAQGIYFSSFSSYGAESGILNIFEDRAEFVSRAGQSEVVPYPDIRAARLYTETLELALTNGTTKSFGIERDLQDAVLSFIKDAIQPYVLRRTVGFDASFGIDERLEINEERGVFHLLRQGGSEITEECPLDALVRCELVERGAPKSALGLLAGAAKAVGVQDKLGAPDADDVISCVGVELTIREVQGPWTEMVRFGDFSLGMSRTNKKYDQYLAEASRFMDYLGARCPACELVVPPPPEPKAAPAETPSAPEVLPAVAGENLPAAPAVEKDELGIIKYIEGVSRFIESCPTPMTIAIQGSLGRTSFMKLLSEHLDEGSRENLIWLHSGQLARAKSDESFALQVENQLRAQLGGITSEATKGRMRQAAKGLGSILISAATGGNSDGQDLMEAMFGAGGETPREALSGVFSELVKNSPAGRRGKIVVFLDELDRLAPAKAVDMLRALRDFFDCEGCVLAAAIDFGFFQRGMRERPGAEPNEAEEKALFDEIFQMSFRMPASGYDVRNYVKSKLEHMGIPAAEDSEELDLYAALIRQSVGGEPKSMDRLFNSFLLLKNMADRELYEDRVQRLMLFALLCMQTRFQAAYDYLKQIRDQVTPALLSGLCGEDSEVAARSGLSGEERTKFLSFAQVFHDIINTDHTEEISRAECAVFAKVLEFSSITSK